MSKRSPRAGFALAEVMVAVLLLAVAMLPILYLFPSGAKRSAFGEAHLRAHLRARALLVQSIDMAVRTGFRDLPEGEGVPATASQGAHETVFFEPVRGYQGLWTVTAEVEWEAPIDEGGDKRTYRLQKLVHRTEQGLLGDWPLAPGGVR